MNYIIIDLEWNQPINHQVSAYRKYGDRIIFEMIQIGAVRLDEQCRIVDSISIPIHPVCYPMIHPRIRKMTGLDSETLADAPAFEEALEQFAAWCGEDYALLTWGCDDVSVFQQNLDFHRLPNPLPPMCDIQHLFSDLHQMKNRMALHAAMELLQIDPEEDRAFHNALNDAYYTALVFQRMGDPAQALRYPQKPKQLIREKSDLTKKVRGERFASIAEALASETAAMPLCPVCGRPAAIEAPGYVPQAADKYIGLSRCRAHGPLMTRLTFRVVGDGERWMSAATAKATAQNIAYIHTKQLQVASRPRPVDPERALENASGSYVPFAD